MSKQKEEPPSGGILSKTLTALSSKYHGLFRRSSGSIEESVVELIDEIDPDGKELGSSERSMLQNVLDFKGLKVSDIMIPRTDIIAVDSSLSLQELRSVIIEKEHTRMPVYKDNLDDIIGFIHIKDLIPFFDEKKQFDINGIIREILFVPKSMRAVDLLAKMRDSCVHIAIVLDEYGGADGLVSIENVVEEIIGEIKDEHDEEDEVDFIQIDQYTYNVGARLRIEDLEKKFEVDFFDDEDEDFDTIGGLLFYMAGKVPHKDEIIKHSNGFMFKILDVDARKINKIQVSLPK